MAPKTRKKPKLPPDKLPGDFDERVFIGGNYDNIGLLRNIQDIVHELGLGLTAILPRDDIAVPLHDVHDWDLRILHNCRYAIFDVSIPGGELMEIERVGEYGTKTLLLYQSRDEGPPEHITRMLRTFNLSLKGYHKPSASELKKIIREFLFPTTPLDATMEAYLSVVGYYYSSVSALDTITKDGLSTERLQYKDLTATSDRPIAEIENHYWSLTVGDILDVKLRPINCDPKRVQWVQGRRDAKNVMGKVVIDPPLKKGDEGVSYEFIVKSRAAYCLTKSEFKHAFPKDPNIVEWYERKIVHPVGKLEMGVKFYRGYPFNPDFAVFYGGRRDVNAATSPMVSFESPSPTAAVLSVAWPKPGHSYRIFWNPAKTG